MSTEDEVEMVTDEERNEDKGLAPPQMDESIPAVVKSHAPQLPMSRVKSIMKYDPDVSLTSSDTVYLIAKCTEMFIAKLSETSYHFTVQGKRKTIQKKDIDQSIISRDYFSFLEGILDKTVL